MTKSIPLSEVREGDFLVCNGKRTRVRERTRWDNFISEAASFIYYDHCVELGITAERNEKTEPLKIDFMRDGLRIPLPSSIFGNACEIAGGGSLYKANAWADALPVGTKFRLTLEVTE